MEPPIKHLPDAIVKPSVTFDPSGPKMEPTAQPPNSANLLAAIQSAIFYYVACTPCSQVRHRKRRKEIAKREREEKLRIEAEQPGRYQHPSPFHTNPYWEEEISMGPSLPKKSGSKNNSQRGLTSAGKDSATGDSTSGSITAGPNSTVATEEVALSGEGWNKKRYQREDEELWGHDISRAGRKIMDAIVEAGSSAGRMIEATLGKEKGERQVTDEDRHNFYLAPKIPPVNDYHPPVVSCHPSQRDRNRWMVQPPPPAKLMEGKIPVSRTGSSHSMVSRRGTGPVEENLGRVVRAKPVQAKLKSGETPTESELIDSLIGTRSRRATVSSTGRSARSQLSLGSDDSDGFGRRRKLKTRPVAMEIESEDDEDEAVALPRSSESLGPGSGHAAPRPKPETILGSSSNANRRTGSGLAREHKIGDSTEKVTEADVKANQVLVPA